jgi:hypothetical protein
MDAVVSDGWKQAGATGTMLSHGRMTLVALTVADTEQGETVGAGDQPERPGKSYHEFRYWSSEAMTHDSDRPDQCRH